MRIRSRVRLSATRDAFQFGAELEAFEDDQPFGSALAAGDPPSAGVRRATSCRDPDVSYIL